MEWWCPYLTQCFSHLAIPYCSTCMGKSLDYWLWGLQQKNWKARRLRLQRSLQQRKSWQRIRRWVQRRRQKQRWLTSLRMVLLKKRRWVQRRRQKQRWLTRRMVLVKKRRWVQRRRQKQRWLTRRRIKKRRWLTRRLRKVERNSWKVTVAMCTREPTMQQKGLARMLLRWGSILFVKTKGSEDLNSTTSHHWHQARAAGQAALAMVWGAGEASMRGRGFEKKAAAVTAFKPSCHIIHIRYQTNMANFFFTSQSSRWIWGKFRLTWHTLYIVPTLWVGVSLNLSL